VLEWFLHSLIFERTKPTYQKLTSFVALFDLISIMIVPWDKFSLCHTLIRLLSAFQDQISILIMGCVITRFASTSLTVEIWKRKQRVIYFIKKKCHRPFAQNKKVRHVRHIFLVQVDNPFLWFLFQDCFFLLLLNCTIKKNTWHVIWIIIQFFHGS